MTITPAPRSVRNNNPGNLEANGMPWRGIAERSEMTTDQKNEARFCVFRNPMFGFRALAIVLLTGAKAGRVTIRQIIERFAPPGENNTDAYIKAVRQSIGAEPDKALDLFSRDTLASLCRAIAIHEAGGWFFDVRDLDSGVEAALDRENRTTLVPGPLVS